MMPLINFVLCSGLLLLVYRVFLQGEKMYRFNRFYLLFSLLFSAAVPFITITTHTESLPASYQRVVDQAFTSSAPVTATTTSVQPVHPLPDPDFNTAIMIAVVVIGLYALITLVLLARFVVNLYRINRTITGSECIALDDAQLVLTDSDVTPHSFLSYVFVNRDDYPDGLEPQIICHEQAHVRQRHSLDVLLVELMQVLCWFNPFIPFYRRAIQLNHEFLADEAVINRSYDTIAYQYLLLAKASQHSSIHLASQFNYQTTKKRLTMMTKTTSVTKATGKQLLMLPVVAAAVMLFSQKTTASMLPPILPAIKTIETPPAKRDTPKVDMVRFAIPKAMRTKYSATDASEKVMSEYASILKKYNIPDGEGKSTDISAADKAQLHALFIQMSERQQNRQQFRFAKAFKPVAKNMVTAAQLNQWQDKKYGVWVNDKRIKNADLANYKAEDFDQMSFSRLMPLAIKNDGFSFQVNLMTKPYYAEYYKKTIANQEDRIDYWHIMRKK